ARRARSTARCRSGPWPRTRRLALRIAIGVGRAVAALQPHLVWPVALRPVDEEFRVEANAAFGLGIELDHPAVNAVGIELRIDRPIEGVGEIDPPPVAADLDHLRAAVELAVLGAGMDGARNDAADAHFPGQLGIERIGDVILLEVAGAPARHVKEAVV